MSKAKIASKNNPTTRGAVIENFHKGRKIKPVKLVLYRTSIMGAEFEDGELVLGPDGAALPWARAKSHN